MLEAAAAVRHGSRTHTDTRLHRRSRVVYVLVGVVGSRELLLLTSHGKNSLDHFQIARRPFFHPARGNFESTPFSFPKTERLNHIFRHEDINKLNLNIDSEGALELEHFGLTALAVAGHRNNILPQCRRVPLIAEHFSSSDGLK